VHHFFNSESRSAEKQRWKTRFMKLVGGGGLLHGKNMSLFHS
jgi:hypothetical protein